MSATQTARLDALLVWLEENTFWNSDLIEVRPSICGGVGVFWRLGPEDDPIQDRLMVRVPKSNILSPKNSFLYSLLVDYQESDPEIDISVGMHALVITFIYELALGEDSPWYPYLASVAVEDAPLPLCFWTDHEKEAFHNTECDLLNMLDETEVIALYWEGVAFARKNRLLVPVPDVFETEDGNTDKLLLFGQYVQAVISRAFDVDKYHRLSLVPGADLFNHISPIELGEMVEIRENVHFECDDDDDLCEICGETACPHLGSDAELDEDEEEELEELELDDEDLQKMAEVNESDADSGADIDIDEEDVAELLEKDTVEEESENSQSESEHEHEHENEHETESEADNEMDYDEEKPITMEDIAALEQESDAETIQDDEEISTLSLSGDEDDEDDQTRVNPSAAASELAAELSDGSKCCDIILSHLPNQKFQYELFNTYGNDLLNSYLLQRYGFVSHGNPNTSCLLTVQMYGDLKRLKKTTKGKTLIELKLQWYEDVGFPIVNELCTPAAQPSGKGHDHSHRHGGGCCDNDSLDSEHQEKLPEKWQLSARICAEGYPTEQTLALLRLMQMNFTVFYQKLYRAPSERRLQKRIQHYLLQEKISSGEKAVLKRWILERLNRYKPEVTLPDLKGEMVRVIISEEKALLKRATQFLSK